MLNDTACRNRSATVKVSGIVPFGAKWSGTEAFTAEKTPVLARSCLARSIAAGLYCSPECTSRRRRT